MRKKIIYSITIITILFLLSYNYYINLKYRELNLIYETWMVNEMWHRGEELTRPEEAIVNYSFPMGFNKNHTMWIRYNGLGKDAWATFELSKKGEEMIIDIKDSSDDILNGNYTIYIDTLQNSPKYCMLQLTLDSEDTYIVALRNHNHRK